MRLIYCCLLAVALLSYLADAGKHQNPEWPPKHPHPWPQKHHPPPPPPPQQKHHHHHHHHHPQKPRAPQDSQWPQAPQDPQRPHDPQKTTPPNPQKPQIPTQTFHSCEVEAQAKIHCGAPTISASECEAINCCFDGKMCYYGKSVTLQCTKDGQFIIVVARDATLPNIDLESVSLLGSGSNCHPVGTTSAFAIYQFPVTACGTVMREEPGVIIYENRMSSAYEVAVGRLGAITRDSQYELFVQCRYIGTAVEAVVIEVGLVPPPPPVAAPGPLRVELRLGNGICTVKGCVEEDVAYTSFYTDADYPVTKVLRDPVYVEIRMLERTDPHLVLTLGRCWATISEYPQSLPQWDLLIGGCPNPDDRYLTHLVSVDPSSGLMYPTHYRRFVFKMFTFVGASASDPTKKAPADPGLNPLKEKVYIHCNVAVCQPSPSNTCEPSCHRQKREISSSTKKLYREETTVVSSKEVIMVDTSAE
ncbi:zona pellucida sperm-binding protein 4-like [Melanotaenia boesemani]|uniref:zona pellucida sperm-binding protein 4-like n=1 Tax=Melanotaenia boesemani TaxID=1250792 RepID=UPI001C053517|nr:zona pellucida sperm-binding protein 4-like [Melanotaenia boesemani]